MFSTIKLNFDLARKDAPQVAYAVQGESNTRILEITLRENGVAWSPPSGASIAVVFEKRDGTRGVYDMLPNGDQAITVTGNVVSAILAPQVLTCPGEVKAALLFVDQNGNKLMSFPFYIMVAEDPSAGADVSNDYFYFTSFDAINDAIGDMSQLETETKTDLVSAINEAFGGGAKGLTSEEKKVILSLFKAAAYASDVSAKVAELEALWSVSYKVSYSLTGATVSNDATAVVEGSAYNTTLTAEAGYSLTGATVNVTMGGADITSTAYSNGVINIASVTGNVVITVAAREIPSFSITNNLTNVTNSNSATKVTEGDFYSATLNWDSAYILNSLAITMGGVDVTADVYGEGKILITEVTGDVVITAVAEEPVAIETVSNNFNSETLYVGADTNSEKLTNYTAYGSNIISLRATESDTEVRVVLTNNTDGDLSTTLYVFAVPKNSLGDLYAFHLTGYHAVKALNNRTLTAGESCAVSYTLPAGYLLRAYATNQKITVSAFGSLDVEEFKNEYTFTASGSLISVYADDTETTKIAAPGGATKYQTEVFDTDTRLRITTTYTASAGLQSNRNFVCCYSSGSNGYYGVKTAGQMITGMPHSIEYTVKAGYRLATCQTTSILCIEKID